jgi:hypothetical protein
MEDRGLAREEMETESTSNVLMLTAAGTFIAGTADNSVTEVRHSTKRHRALIESTSLPHAVTARSSLLGNPHHVLSCRTFVLSCRSSGLFSEGQLVVGQLDSSSLHA